MIDLNVDALFPLAHDAYTKAAHWSAKYNERADLLTDSEKVVCRSRGIVDPYQVLIRVDGIKDRDRLLNAFYKRYQFWAGEQQRLESHINTWLAVNDYNAARGIP